MLIKTFNNIMIFLKKMLIAPILQITNIYLVIMSIGWLSIHAYFRFFFVRPEYTLSSIKPYVTNYHLCLIAAFIGMHLLFVIVACYNIYKSYTKKHSTFVIIQYLQKIIDYFYWKPLEYLHDRVAPVLPYSGIFLLYVGKLIKPHKKHALIAAVIIFDFFPKIMLAAIFSIELLFYERIYYFVHFISLILLPIMFSVLIKFMESFALRNFPLMRRILVIEPIPHKPGELYGYTFSLQKNYSYLTKEQLDFYAKSWCQLVDLDNYAFHLKAKS